MQKRVTNELSRLGMSTSCRLRVVHGPDAGLDVELPAVGVVIGADPVVDVILHDASVSWEHCSVVPKPDGFLVTDLQSKNGTLLDGIGISKALVPTGAMLRLGETILQLVPADHPLELEPSPSDHFGELVGSSVAMRRAYAVLEAASRTDPPVLLLGETGTGKELAARAIHSESDRRDKPFVVFDCGASSEGLVESDLFGHVRRAFTGAVTSRIGALAAADGGTLFLDEMGDLPLSLQTRLLRLLETGDVVPVGGHAPTRHNVRVVGATHHDLWEEARGGVFRADLYGCEQHPLVNALVVAPECGSRAVGP